jgi:predicted nucleic acid-binding protein
LSAYIDTSFLVSLFSPDSNSISAALTMQKAIGRNVISTLTELEFVNALQLRIFRREISVMQANSSVGLFEQDLRDGVFQLKGLPDAVFERARKLSLQNTAKFGTPTADLVHVAAAVELGADYLYTFDQQQKKLAQALKLGLN